LMAYAVASDVKTYLGIEGSGDDALLTSLISRAQKAIETYCGRKFETSSVTKYYDVPTGGDELYIDGVRRTGHGARTLFLDDDLISINTNGLTNGDGSAISSSGCSEW